jgi:hypothetical protein
MQGTDTGIQTVTGITLPPSGSNPSITGASFNLILARKILEIPINSFSNTIGLDVFNTALPKIEDNSCLFFIMQVPSLVPWPRSFESESSGQFSGLLTFTQG